MPSPNLMDPAHELALYNPNTYVRGSAVEAVGKLYGVKAMKKAERDELNAKARVRQHASMHPLPYSPVSLTNEEETAFDELIEDDEEEEIAEEGEGGEGEPTGLDEKKEEEGSKLAMGAAAHGKMTEQNMTEEKSPDVEEKGKSPALGATTSANASTSKSTENIHKNSPSVRTSTLDIKGKSPVASTTTEATSSKPSARSQKKEEKKKQKKQQIMPAQGTTAWYL